VGFGIPGILEIRLKKSKKSKRIKGKKEGRRGTNIRGLANGVIWGDFYTPQMFLHLVI
jgi:hypothetical protein